MSWISGVSVLSSSILRHVRIRHTVSDDMDGWGFAACLPFVRHLCTAAGQ